LRAVSLSQQPVFEMLKKDFVVGVFDITGQPWAGASGQHALNSTAIATTDGAGPHNIQMFVLAPDGTVIHCLPGYWEAKDLAIELKFAEDLYRVYTDSSMTLAQKRQIASAMQLEHIKKHSVAMQVRSRMQPFDAQHELARRDNNGTVIRPPVVGPLLAMAGFRLTGIVKSTDEIMHERMARQPYVPYDQFDIADFVDYGTQFYDRRENGVKKRVLAKVESELFGHQAKQSSSSSGDARTPAANETPTAAASSMPVRIDRTSIGQADRTQSSEVVSSSAESNDKQTIHSAKDTTQSSEVVSSSAESSDKQTINSGKDTTQSSEVVSSSAESSDSQAINSAKDTTSIAGQSSSIAVRAQLKAEH